MRSKNTKAVKIALAIVAVLMFIHLGTTIQKLLQPPPIPVLLFHSIGRPSYRSDIWGISKARFCKILDFLKERGVRTLQLKEVRDLVLKGKAPPDPPYVLLTFDDACNSHKDVVIPELSKRNQKGLFFVTFPWEVTFREKGKSQAFLKSPKELATLLTSGEIQSHTMDYQTLPKKNNETQKAYEQRIQRNLVAYRKTLAAVTKQEIYALAYPSGEYNAKVKDLVTQGGYTLAFTTEYDQVTERTDPLEIPRYMITGNDSLEDIQSFVIPGRGVLFGTIVGELIFFCLVGLWWKKGY